MVFLTTHKSRNFLICLYDVGYYNGASQILKYAL